MKRAGTGGRSKKSGWHKDARMRMGEVPFEAYAPPARPTRWDLLLGELGVTEAQALNLLEESRSRLSGTAAAIRQWVRKHCRRAFVPEPVLAALGLGEHDVCSVDIDREACAERARAVWAARGKR